VLQKAKQQAQCWANVLPLDFFPLSPYLPLPAFTAQKSVTNWQKKVVFFQIYSGFGQGLKEIIDMQGK